MVCDCKYEQVDRFIIKVRDFIKKYHASSKVTSPLQMKRDGWDEHGSTPKCRVIFSIYIILRICGIYFDE